jgi:hypothetical protein
MSRLDRRSNTEVFVTTILGWLLVLPHTSLRSNDGNIKPLGGQYRAAAATNCDELSVVDRLHLSPAMETAVVDGVPTTVETRDLFVFFRVQFRVLSAHIVGIAI